MVGSQKILFLTKSNALSAVAAVVLFTNFFPLRMATALSVHSRGSEQALFITTTPSPKRWFSSQSNNSKPIPPEIYSFRVESHIRHRYSRTLITSRVVNRDAQSTQEVTFSVILPETAFISKFVMELDGTAYEAYVKEKEQAKRDYSQAQSQGQSAGLIEKSTRNTNVFNVNVNIRPKSKVNFNLTYEELLVRKLGRYEQAININPDQFISIRDYKIIVNVEESRNLKFIRVPSLSNDVNESNQQDDVADVVIDRPAPNKAKISWSPLTLNKTKLVKGKPFGKFLVHYDVDREADAGQILLMQGYFVHFFAPEKLPPLRKHVIFILDISMSMLGRKMEQMKESQRKILEDLSPDDYFNIITFSSDVDIWSPEGNSKTHLMTTYPATSENVNKAKGFINLLEPYGGTYIYGALTKALELTKAIREGQSTLGSYRQAKEMRLPENVHSLIIFLTDGEPTIGLTIPTEIQNRIRFANQNLSIPIYSLGFGEKVDFAFLKKLSLQNYGFARKIYEASDAVLQLEGFYNEISSPLLSNVTFNYTSGEYNVTDVTLTKFPIVFGGSEIAVAGKLVTLPQSEMGKEHRTSTLKQSGRNQRRYFDSALKPRRGDHSIGCNVKKLQVQRFSVTVSIGGVGRSGKLELHHVKRNEQAPRCGAGVNISTLSSLQNASQTAPKSQPFSTSEDMFLERLWAYLTISQLIETVSSGISQVSYRNKTGLETPKEHALRLALRYGFVTPLTSLVVVKPDNNSAVTNALPSDGHPDDLDLSNPYESQAFLKRPPIRRIPASVGPTLQTYPVSPDLSDEAQPLVSGSLDSLNVGHKGNLGSPFQMMSSALSDGPAYSFRPSSQVYLNHELPFKPSPARKPPTSLPRLTLDDITWLTQHIDVITVNRRNYRISRNSTSDDNEGYECSNSMNGSQGHCRHLQNCVLPALTNHPSTYKESYFCKITALSSNAATRLFAGVCCPSGNSVATTTTRRSFHSPFTHNFSR